MNSRIFAIANNVKPSINKNNYGLTIKSGKYIAKEDLINDQVPTNWFVKKPINYYNLPLEFWPSDLQLTMEEGEV